MEMHKHVFVTGASSELMQEVLKKVDKSKYKITGLTRSKEPANLENVAWVVGDISQPDSYRSAVENADIIMHAAAITHSKEPEAYYDVNLEGTRSLIKAIPKGKDPLFVFISSRVAGEESGAYGVSKLRAEEEVRKLDSWLIIRPSEVYGGSKSEGIEKTINEAIKGGIQLCPVGVESKMYPIHLTDTATAIYHNTFVKTESKKVLILNGKKGYSFHELLELIKKVSGKKMTIFSIPKWFLQLVGLVSAILPISIGFVPDQVARLYSHKTQGLGEQETITLEAYIKQLVAKENG